MTDGWDVFLVFVLGFSACALILFCLYSIFFEQLKNNQEEQLWIT